MRYPVEETAAKHRRLVDAASRLLRAKGLDGVSVGEAMKAAGMTHGAFYSHFGTKIEMAEAAIAHALDEAHEEIRQLIEASPDARSTFLDSYLSRAHRDNAANGCTMAALAVEVGRHAVGRSTFTNRLKRSIQQAASGFSWGKRRSARDQAILMTAAMVGAVILARAVDDPKLSDEILTATRRELV
jgi:TetR/AcrR family transcriptional repressor of nem operon